jgi:hypothetical protein
MVSIGFDRELARLLLEICRYTYAVPFEIIDEQNDAEKWIDSDAVNKNIHYSHKFLRDNQTISTSVASVFCYPDKNIVSYMGTKTEFNTIENTIESVSDWLENFKGVLVPFELEAEQLGLEQGLTLEGHVHNGFLKELKKIQAQVIKELLAIEKREGKKKPLYVTGHSQGGAIAALATRAFLAADFPVAATYTFAAPRSGNKEFAASILAKLPYQFHRIEFGDDIVPHVPPRLIHELLGENRKYGFSLEYLEKKLLRDMFIHTNFFKHFDLSLEYVSVGRLCYGNNDTNPKLQIVDLDPTQEHDIFKHLAEVLLTNPKNLIEHHHLAGTTAQVNNHPSQKGNYTALVS